MNNQIKLAVAAALLAAASSANAGISIPAGDWTLDIGGIVNAYYTSTRLSGSATTGYGGLFMGGTSKTVSNITTGLLPNYLTVSGTTRQNDLDVGFTISIQPGSSSISAGGQAAVQENRQAFLTFGDKSWGSFKLGKDLGIYASDAILNDMTLLGVGSGAGKLAGNTTTLGRIGSGFMYADWKSQVAYTTPNFNGFSATVGVTQAWNAINVGAITGTGTTALRGGSSPAFEGKASYDFSADAVKGKVWVSGITQKVEGAQDRAESADIGVNLTAAGFGLTGYYYAGSGIGQTMQLNGGFDSTLHARDSEGGYVQATYTLPTATKLGVSWGKSTLDANSTEAATGNLTDEMWTIGAYHPLTKHLNLVAEYSDAKTRIEGSSVAVNNKEGRGKTVSLGAILFF